VTLDHQLYITIPEFFENWKKKYLTPGHIKS
jgi:hypothetical protein